MNESTKKALIVLLTQIKNTVVSLEDLVLNTSCEWSYTDSPKKPEPQKRPNNAPELDSEEENQLEQSLERERLAIMQSDKVLKDLWSQGQK
jgi:hypothetical protein